MLRVRIQSKESILNPPVRPGSSHDPYWSDPVDSLDVSGKSRVFIRFSSDEINRLGYPVVVEQWYKFVGPHAYGKQRRAWMSSFTPEERKKAGVMHKKFYNWYLRSGTPESVLLTYDTYNFIRRLAAFFASA